MVPICSSGTRNAVLLSYFVINLTASCWLLVAINLYFIVLKILNVGCCTSIHYRVWLKQFKVCANRICRIFYFYIIPLCYIPVNVWICLNSYNLKVQVVCKSNNRPRSADSFCKPYSVPRSKIIPYVARSRLNILVILRHISYSYVRNRKIRRGRSSCS